MHSYKMSRAAADDRSSGKSYSNIQRGNAARRQRNRQAPHLFKLLACNENPFLLGVKGGYSLSEEREYPPYPVQRLRRCYPSRTSAGVSSILLINRQPKRQFDTKLLSPLSFLLILGPRLIIVWRHAEQR